MLLQTFGKLNSCIFQKKTHSKFVCLQLFEKRLKCVFLSWRLWASMIVLSLGCGWRGWRFDEQTHTVGKQCDMFLWCVATSVKVSYDLWYKKQNPLHPYKQKTTGSFHSAAQTSSFSRLVCCSEINRRRLILWPVYHYWLILLNKSLDENVCSTI